MPANRFYIDRELEGLDVVVIEGKEHHHLVHVTRNKEGDTVELVNGRGDLATAIVDRISKHDVSLKVRCCQHKPPPPFKVILAQALPRTNRMENILEKATEIGVTEFWFFPGERSEKLLKKGNKNERIKAVTISAMKQCGRLHLPKIEIKEPLVNWGDLTFSGYFGDIREKAPPFLSALKHEKKDDGIIFFIGPESGFSEAEIDLLIKKGAQGACLGNHILRTDTAPLVALSIINQWLLIL